MLEGIDTCAVWDAGYDPNGLWTLVRILRVFLVAPDRNWMPYSRVERTVAVYICLRMCACTPVRLAITFMTSSLLWALRARCFA